MWAGFVVVGVLFGPVTPAEARRAAEEVFRDKTIQRRWSNEADPLPPPREPGRVPVEPPRREPAAPPDRQAEPDSRSSPSTDLPAAVLWIVLGVGVAIAAVQLLRAWRGPAAKDVRAPDPLGKPRADTVPAPPVLDTAALLANEGRFGEAVHALLLMALAAAGRRAYQDASLTSREVAAAASALGGEGARALQALVRAVEVSRFGGRPVERAHYDAAREHWERVRDALARPAA